MKAAFKGQGLVVKGSIILWVVGFISIILGTLSQSEETTRWAMRLFCSGFIVMGLGQGIGFFSVIFSSIRGNGIRVVADYPAVFILQALLGLASFAFVLIVIWFLCRIHFTMYKSDANSD